MPSNPYPSATWRLIYDRMPLTGAENMARDEALLRQVQAGVSPPTVRFYSWQPPTLSLGRSQPIEDVDHAAIAELGYGLVRRPTGGRAILHTRELTYSVAVTQRDPRVSGDIIESYRRLSLGLLAGLTQLGANARNDQAADAAAIKQMGAVCFEVPSHYEVTVEGKKLIGSAQMRKAGVVLQHGSLPLTGDLGEICAVLAYPADERKAAAARVREHAATLAEALGLVVDWQTAASALAAGLGQHLNLTWVDGGFTAAELSLVETLVAEKYAHPDWTLNRTSAVEA